MEKSIKLKFNLCDIEVHNGISMSGGIVFGFTEKSDGEGNKIPEKDRVKFVHELDNYQAYKLAMSILSGIDVKG